MSAKVFATYDEVGKMPYINIKKMNEIKFYNQLKVFPIGRQHKRLLLMLCSGVLLFLSISEATSQTWTGVTDSNWFNTSNWSNGLVPTASTDVVINSTGNNPTINAPAIANSIYINTNAELTVNNAGSLTIDNTGSNESIDNRGTVSNNGNISIGTNTDGGNTAVFNSGGTFNNLAGSTLVIDRASTNALSNSNGGIFHNSGEIYISESMSVNGLALTSSGAGSIFNNYATGTITIYKGKAYAMMNNHGSIFTNEGTLNVGAPNSGISQAIWMEGGGTLNNNSTGTINIDYIDGTAYWKGGIFSTTSNTGGGIYNDGIIQIGLQGGIVGSGITSYHAFINNGTIHVENFQSRGVQQITGPSMENNGILKVIANGTSNLAISGNSGQIKNNSSGHIQVGSGGSISGSALNSLGGQISPEGISILEMSGNHNFGNSTWNLEINGTGVAGTDYDQIKVGWTATFGADSKLNVITNYTPVDGDQVVILEASTLSGTFGAGSNFDGWTVQYDTPNSGDITLERPLSCDLAISGVTTTAESCPGESDGTVTITANCTDCVGSIEYSVNGSAFQSSASFTGVASGAVTAIARDASQTTTCTATDNSASVGVATDTNNPTVNCPSDISVFTDSGKCEAIVNWTTITASDDCGTANITNSTASSGDVFQLGTTTVTYTATDGSSNVGTCSFDVTVTDNIAPSYTNCPTNMTLSTTVGGCTAPATWTSPTASDNCAIASNISNHNSGASFSVGTTTVTYTATDNAGLIGTCTFMITVEDNEAPTANCPADIMQDAAAGVCESVVTWSPITVSDNCSGGSVTGSTHISGDTFEVGTTNVEYTIQDAAGNTATCSFDVIIEDATAPTFTCPDAQNVAVDTNCEASMPDLTGNLVGSDNCTSTVTFTQSPLAGETVLGATTATVTAMDAAGNSSDCTVAISISDTTAPVFTCPADKTEVADTDACSALSYVFNPYANDNCDSNPSLSATCATSFLFGWGNAQIGSFTVGVHEIVFTATDEAGNSSSCTTLITIEDVTVPTLVGCPTAPVTAIAPADECGTTVQFGLIYPNDACGQAMTLASTHISGDYFDVGTTTVTFTATDSSGNEGECSFDVTVIDETDPVLACQDFTVNLDATGNATLAVADLVSSVVDNCPITLADVSLDINAFTCINVGTPVTVTATATDASSNTGTCTSAVTVMDNILPTALCQDLTVSLGTDGTASVSATDIDNNSTDNCPSFTLAISSGKFTYDCTDHGMDHIVELTVTDASSQTATCTATVSVVDDQTPIISCPANMSVSTDLDACTALVSFAMPTVVDNCTTTTTQTEGEISGTPLALGVHTNAYSVVDAAGNSASCSFTITVSDGQNPEALCQDASVQLDANGMASITAAEINNGSNDNCTAVPSLGLSQTDFVCADAGDNTVTLTVTDDAGNTASCTATITVEDNIAPVLTGCPTDITQGNDAGACSAVVTWTPPVASDNCTTTMGSSHEPGDSFEVGTTAVTYSVIDAAGNTASCSFDIVISDDEDPTITCPSNIAVNNDSGTCGAVVTWSEPTYADNCAGATLSSDYNSGATFDVGMTTVNYTVTDAAQNSTDCSFTVNVIDNEVPVIAACPADITVDNDPNACSAVVTWTAPSATDNCTFTLTSTHDSGDDFAVGTMTVTYTAEDASGLTSTCSFDITVNDTENPTLFCPADIAQGTDDGQCAAVVTWSDPAIMDNCPGGTLNSDHNSGDVFSLGTTTVNYTVTDAAGNTATCSFDVVISDDEDPIITGCPADIIQDTDTGICGAVVSWTAPIATDNCTVDLVNSHDSGTSFAAGTTTVTYTATDDAGNSATCSFDVTVNDTEAPTITCPADIAANNDNGTCGAIVTWTAPITSDNCTGETTMSDYASGDFFNVGTTTVNYTVTDAAGNTETCSFDVVISDTEAPVIADCPSDITVDNDLDDCGADVVWTAPTAMDNCSVTISSSHTSGANFVIGTTPVTYTATDDAGLTATCIFNVTVNDTQNPTITCPADIVEGTDVGLCSAVVNWTTPTFADNCTGASIASDYNSGATFPVGSTTVNYTVTDAAGNTATCSFDVLIIDDEAPVIAGCPENISQDNAIGQCNAAVSWTAPTATDNCGVELTSSHSPNATFEVGTTTVTYTATDDAGLTATCSFDVTVNDTENPTISCPADIIQGTDNGDCVATVTWSDPTFADNCTGASISSNANSGSTFEIGTTTVDYTVTDAAGNTATCSFDVVISDNELPNALCQDITIQLDNQGIASITAAQIDNGSTDNCGIDTVVPSQTAFDCSHVGNNTVSLTVTDIHGNVSSCDASVTVVDDILPVVTDCPTAMNISPMPNMCTGLASWAVPTFSDNCNQVNVSLDTEGIQVNTNGGFTTGAFPGGETTITYTGVDPSGNSVDCAFTITVEDDILPIITSCPSDITGSTDAGSCEAQVFWAAPSFSDNCPDYVVVSSAEPGDIFPIGTTSVGYTITDASGNVATCDFSVTISDEESPVISCPSTAVLAGNDGNCNFTIPDLSTAITASDNCSSSPMIAQSMATGTSITTTTTIDVTATDDAGNSALCKVEITVPMSLMANATAQDASCPLTADGNVMLTVTGGTEPYTFTWSNGATSPELIGVTADAYDVTVTDANGCIATATAIVNGTDDEAPIADCDDITIQLESNGMVTIDPSALNDDSSDDCGPISFTASQTTFSCAELGQIVPVTVTVTDGAGMTDQCIANVTVANADFVAPAFCGDSFDVELNAQGFASVDPAIFGAVNDACGIAFSDIIGNSTFDCSHVGTPQSVTVSFINVTIPAPTCTVTINVQDVVAPVAVCNAVTAELDANGMAVISANEAGLGSSDNCGTVTLSLSNDTFTCSDITPSGGSPTTVTLTVTDVQGLTATCQVPVTVEDNTATLPDFCFGSVDVEVNQDGVVDFDINSLGPIDDNCGSMNVFVMPSQPAVLDCSHIGMSINRTVVFFDSYGNGGFCTLTLNVVDNSPAVAECLPTYNMSLDDNGNAVVLPENIDNGSFDNCNLSMITDSGMYSCSDIGSTFTITLTAMDDNMNNAPSTCTTEVTIIDDTVPNPMLCDEPITLELDNTGSATLSAANFPPIEDNCTTTAQFIFFGKTDYACADVSPINFNVPVLVVDGLGGNIGSCTAEIYVTDPLGVCVQPLVGNPDQGAGSVIESRGENITLDQNNGQLNLSSVNVSPNPFAVQTKISYTISVPSKVAISVLDARGQIVERIVDSVKRGGKHNAFWRPQAGVAHGLYFILIETEGNENEIIKVNYTN